MMIIILVLSGFDSNNKILHLPMFEKKEEEGGRKKNFNSNQKKSNPLPPIL